jgi:hypothetical protein
MVGVALLVVSIVLPVVSCACFLVWLARRPGAPTWALALAIVPPLALLPLIAWWTLQGESVLIGLLLAVLPVVSVVALVTALVRRSRGRAEGGVAVLGLAAPLPLMALLVLVYVFSLVLYPGLLDVG